MVGLLLGQRRRRWTNIIPTIGSTCLLGCTDQNTRLCPNVELMLAQRRIRLPNINPTFGQHGQRLVFSGASDGSVAEACSLHVGSPRSCSRVVITS